jgi:hypothetical protein
MTISAYFKPVKTGSSTGSDRPRSHPAEIRSVDRTESVDGAGSAGIAAYRELEIT